MSIPDRSKPSVRVLAIVHDGENCERFVVVVVVGQLVVETFYAFPLFAPFSSPGRQAETHWIPSELFHRSSAAGNDVTVIPRPLPRREKFFPVSNEQKGAALNPSKQRSRPGRFA